MSVNNYNVEVLDTIVDLSKAPTFSAAKVVYVNGKNTLAKKTKHLRDSKFQDYYIYYHTEIRLNDIPLMQIGTPSCPTCAQILATGYGISDANCKELDEISKKINASFVSLDDSIEVLKPLLALLESGLYIIADAVCFPTDGNGNFFWNVPNEPTENIATVPIYLPEMDYTYVSVPPVYLYPTQSTDCYNENRVKHYIDMFKTIKNQPRAIVYNIGESVNFVIDGHHKACAASILGRPLNCILIAPFLMYRYITHDNKCIPVSLNFSCIEIPIENVAKKYLPKSLTHSETEKKYKDMETSEYIPTGTIIRREWEKEYLDSTKNYLSAHEYAIVEYADIPYGDKLITDDIIESCFNSLYSDSVSHAELEEDCIKMEAILLALKCVNKSRMRKTALKFAEFFKENGYLHNTPIYDAAKQVYKLLSEIKNDEDIEQLFIDYIVECEDKTDPILFIVHKYWD